MENIQKVVDYVASYIASVPAESWYTLGALLGSSGLVIGIVAWIKRRHLRKYAEALATQFVAINVVFWSSVTTVLSFVLTNGSTFASFLPFLGTHMPQIIALSTVLYQISKPMKQWWADRKSGKAIQNPNMPALSEQLQTASTTLYGQNNYGTVSGKPSGSMGSVSAGVEAPPKDLFF